MSGLQWVSYNSDSTLNAGNNNSSQLYQNAITFFVPSRTPLKSGTLTQFLSSDSFGNSQPDFASTFSNGTKTTDIAIKLTGYICPTQTGTWTVHLGNGLSNPCDDMGILFIGEPDNEIVPDATFTTLSSVPSSNLPFLSNVYNSPSNSKTITLSKGVYYPILLLYNQGAWGYTFGLGFSINGGSLITDLSTITRTVVIPCFNEGTKILTDNGYKLIEELRNGDLVKTVEHGYKPIDMIGKRDITHKVKSERIPEQLYKCSPTQFNEVFEDLIITGCHSILVPEFKNDEREKTQELLGDIYVTDMRYRLPACLDERTTVYEKPGTYTIYHFALENEDYYMNYGVYANGLLVESCSKRYLKEISNMEIIN
jgi:hypothetical protein